MPRLILALGLLFLPSGPLGAQSDSGFAAWAKARAVPVAPPARAFRTLDSVARGARLIAVGESVHDVPRFMELRFELLQHLVRDRRVTALVLESGLPEAITVDEYVKGRRDSVDFAAQLGPGYNGPIVQRAIAWLRAWNLGEGKAHPVSVYGADISIGDGRSMLPAMNRLQGIVGNDAQVTAALDALRPLATRVEGRWWNAALRNYAALGADDKARLTRVTTDLLSAVRAWRAGTAEHRAWAERFALVVQQDEVMLRTGPFSPEAPRDAAMAANTRWIVDRLPSGERAVLWAHNAHVQRVAIKGGPVPPGAFPSMGVRLGKELGDAYFAIGTSYGGPSLDSASAPRAGSVDAALAKISAQPYLLPLRDGSTGGALLAWLHADRQMRFQVGHIVLPLADAFDAVVHFDRVSH
jgi:erythromycin esterase